jgi:hypothetical protein
MCVALLCRSAVHADIWSVRAARRHRVREFFCRFTARTVKERRPTLTLVGPETAASQSAAECAGLDTRCPLNCRFIIGDVPLAKDPEARPTT